MLADLLETHVENLVLSCWGETYLQGTTHAEGAAERDILFDEVVASVQQKVHAEKDAKKRNELQKKPLAVQGPARPLGYADYTLSRNADAACRLRSQTSCPQGLSLGAGRTISDGSRRWSG